MCCTNFIARVLVAACESFNPFLSMKDFDSNLFQRAIVLTQNCNPSSSEACAYLSSARDAVSGNMVPSQCAGDGLARGPVETFLGEFKDDS